LHIGIDYLFIKSEKCSNWNGTVGWGRQTRQQFAFLQTRK